jgi:lipoprotein-anchoring transpeptidase ErfK/SrfK
MSEKRIVVNLNAQTLRAFDGAKEVFSFDCVTGSKDHPTDPGTYHVLRKDAKHFSQKYKVPMHYALFFSRDGKAIHQYHGLVPLTVVRAMKEYVSDYLGSHGCVRLVEEDARAMFEWAALGTKVHVEGRLT